MTTISDDEIELLLGRLKYSVGMDAWMANFNIPPFVSILTEIQSLRKREASLVETLKGVIAITNLDENRLILDDMKSALRRIKVVHQITSEALQESEGAEQAENKKLQKT